MSEVTTQTSEIVIDNYVFHVGSHFSEDAEKSVADTLASLILKRVQDRVETSQHER